MIPIVKRLMILAYFNSDIRLELQLSNQKKNDYTKIQRNLLINDYIKNEYSRYMTILENARSKMLTTSNRELMDLRVRGRSAKFTRLMVQTSANLLKNVTSNLRRNSFSYSVKSMNQLPEDSKPQSSESIVVANIDKFDPSVNKRNNAGSGDAQARPDDMRRQNLIQLDKERDLEIVSKGTPKKQQDGPPGKKQAQRVVHRKFIYYDQTGNS